MSVKVPIIVADPTDNSGGKCVFHLRGYVLDYAGPPVAVIARTIAHAQAVYAAKVGYFPDRWDVENRGSADRTEVALWGNTG